MTAKTFVERFRCEMTRSEARAPVNLLVATGRAGLKAEDRYIIEHPARDE